MTRLLDLLALVLATGSAASPLGGQIGREVTIPKGASVIARNAGADGLDARFAPPEVTLASARGRGQGRAALTPAVILVPAGWEAARAARCGRI